ncbi:MAG: type II secretion system protein [Planctomycetota bacterium]
MNSVLRRGMTLVELLVVVSIIVLLAAAAIPRLQPAMDRSRVREAARSVQLYLSAARNQAMATGRSCGVMIAVEGGCSMTLTQVETPPTYGGDSMSSMATVTSSGAKGICNITGVSPALSKSDQIQIGYQGYWFNVTSGTTAGLANVCGETPVWTAGQPIKGPYKVLRGPKPSVASALELPSPAVIDLTWSGADPVAGSSPTYLGGTSPVYIMFTPTGSVDWIGDIGNGTKITTPVYLLIGKRENVNDASTPPQWNLQDKSSLWVAINSATGLIVTTDLAAVAVKAKTADSDSDAKANNSVINNSRDYARKSDAMGGK